MVIKMMMGTHKLDSRFERNGVLSYMDWKLRNQGRYEDALVFVNQPNYHYHSNYNTSNNPTDVYV